MRVNWRLAGLCLGCSWLLGMTAFVSPANATVGIIYDFNDTIGGLTVTGTFRTDGTFGTLQAANILGYDLLLSNGTDTFAMTTSDNISQPYLLTGTALTTTSSGLFFDFTGAGSFNFAAFDPNFEGLFACGDGRASSCSPGNTFGETVNGSGVNLIESGDVEIAEVAGAPEPATAVPEPSTWAMLIGALCSVGWLAHRRKGGALRGG